MVDISAYASLGRTFHLDLRDIDLKYMDDDLCASSKDLDILFETLFFKRPYYPAGLPILSELGIDILKPYFSVIRSILKLFGSL